MSEFNFLQFPAEAVHTDARFEQLPASAQCVFEAIRQDGPMTHQGLQERTRMPPRTIRFAVKRLRDEGYLDSRSSLQDCRTCYFFVAKRWIDPAYVQQARRDAASAAADGDRFVEQL